LNSTASLATGVGVPSARNRSNHRPISGSTPHELTKHELIRRPHGDPPFHFRAHSLRINEVRINSRAPAATRSRAAHGPLLAASGAAAALLLRGSPALPEGDPPRRCAATRRAARSS